MKKEVLEEVKKISQEHKKKEKLIICMLYKTIEIGYNANDGIKLLKDFYND